MGEILHELGLSAAVLNPIPDEVKEDLYNPCSDTDARADSLYPPPEIIPLQNMERGEKFYFY